MTPFSAATRFQPIREVEAYWEALRGGRLVPRRSDIDPRGIERALEFAFVLERLAPGLGRLRIAGSHLSELMGMEVRGMPLTALIATDCRARMSDALEQVFAGPAKVELTLRSAPSMGRPPLDARMILLPLKSDLGDITRVLGCLVTGGQTGRAPRRFDITDIRCTPLLKDVGGPDQSVPQSVPDVIPRPDQPVLTGLAEDPARFEPGPAPYLRLVRTDQSG